MNKKTNNVEVKEEVKAEVKATTKKANTKKATTKKEVAKKAEVKKAEVKKEVSTMQAVKRAKSVRVFDDALQMTKSVAVVSENENKYITSDKTELSRNEVLKNISKNQFAIVDEKKKYLSHVEFFKNIAELEKHVKEVFADDETITSNQYFVYSNNRSIKYRIQKSAIEILCSIEISEKIQKALNIESFLSTNSHDNTDKRYCRTVTASTLDIFNDILSVIA